MQHDALNAIPDLTDWSRVADWVNTGLDRIAGQGFAVDAEDRVAHVTMPALTDPDPVLGVYGAAAWRRFALGIFMADWASYTHPADRADFARLLSVVAAFPQGFQLYMAPLQDGTMVPVGYTGWYPISADVFAMLDQNPHHVTHRGFMVPLKSIQPDGNHIYVFNYSVAPPFYKTPLSARVIKDLAQNLKNVPYTGLSAVTVSPDGVRVAEKFGMSYRGDITHDGETEGAYCLRVAA